MDFEKRYIVPDEAEMRVEGDDGQKLTGYGIIYNRKSQPIMDFEEIIRPGAARKLLEDSPDVRCLHNHDPNFVYGRTSSGTMTLEETQRGVKYSATPPDTQWAKDNLISINRGDISGSSFSFRVAEGGDKWSEQNNGLMLREIFEINAIGDLGPVTYPAYLNTTASARSLTEAGIDFDALTALFARVHRGLPLSSADHVTIEQSITVLRSYLPNESFGQEGNEPRASDRHQSDPANLDLLLRELELMEIETD